MIFEIFKKIIKKFFKLLNYDFRSNYFYKSYKFYKSHGALPGKNNDYFSQFNETIFISSKGFLNNANHADKFKISGTNSINMNISNIKDYDSIYICTDAIGKFVNLLPSIQKKFFLFSGDSTLSLSKNNFPNEIKTILKNKNLVRWYAQNLDFHDSRLECLPLGLDYHTGYENPNFFKSKKLFPLEQEEEIFRISSESLPLPKRELKIYANWHFHLDRGDRFECYDSIDKNICFFEPNRIERFQSYRNLSSYAFISSPLGTGLDCHRTYEAIILGSIPIIKKSSISPIFKDLPVCIVEEWSLVNEKYLVENFARILESKFNFSILFNSHWKERNESKIYESDKNLIMTIHEFRKLLKDIFLKQKNLAN